MILNRKMHANNSYKQRSTITTFRVGYLLLFIVFLLFFYIRIGSAAPDGEGQNHSPRVDERFSLPHRFSLPDSNLFERLFKKLEAMIETVVNNVTLNIRYQVSQAIIDVLNKNQVTQVTQNAMTAISQNISTLLSNIPFSQLLQQSLQHSQPIFTQFAKQLTNQQVIQTIKSSLQANDIDFSTIVSEIINATIQQLSNPHSQQEINQVLKFYVVNVLSVVPSWVLVLVVSVLISIVLIPQLLVVIVVQQVFPVRKMGWYQRIFKRRETKRVDEESRRLVCNENVQQ